MAVVSAAQGNRASLEETETPPAPGGGSQSEGTGKSPHGRPALLGKEAHSSPQASLLPSTLRPAWRSSRGVDGALAWASCPSTYG